MSRIGIGILCEIQYQTLSNCCWLSSWFMALLTVAQCVPCLVLFCFPRIFLPFWSPESRGSGCSFLYYLCRYQVGCLFFLSCFWDIASLRIPCQQAMSSGRTRGRACMSCTLFRPCLFSWRWHINVLHYPFRYMMAVTVVGRVAIRDCTYNNLPKGGTDFRMTQILLSTDF